MEKKMPSPKPVSILLAVYEPRMDWLKEQLISLNCQTYTNIKLYIRDDCSRTETFEKVESLVSECVTTFPCAIERNEKNLGSNATFEVLTKEAEGAYFAYCDQDDIWHSKKIETLVQKLENESGVMAYSDMSVIDGEGLEIATSLKDIRHRIRYVQGLSLAETYFFRNCTAGCCMLIDSNIAKSALPFPKETVHDHWLSIVAAKIGRVCFYEKPLVKYRQHGNNQTGVLLGVNDKNSYKEVRLGPLLERMALYEKTFGKDKDINTFVNARLKGNIFQIWRHRRLSPIEAKLEIGMYLTPNFIFKIIVRKIK